MANTEKSILSLIPESLHPQLFEEVEEELKKERTTLRKPRLIKI